MSWKKDVLGFCVVSAGIWAAAAGAAQAQEPYTVQLSVRDGQFYPETLHVPAGRHVKIAFRNEGPGVEEFHSNDLEREEVVLPGNTATVALSPLKPGVYRFIGEFNPSTAKGQIVAK